jgi:hypothetical protein
MVSGSDGAGPFVAVLHFPRAPLLVIGNARVDFIHQVNYCYLVGRFESGYSLFLFRELFDLGRFVFLVNVVLFPYRPRWDSDHATRIVGILCDGLPTMMTVIHVTLSPACRGDTPCCSSWVCQRGRPGPRS